MTQTKLFAEIFTPLMEANGFKRRRNGFYRIYGDGMLQAVAIKPIQNYWLCYANIPYWYCDFLKFPFNMDFTKNHWMEANVISSYKGQLLVTHYDLLNPEQNKADMRLMLEITENVILPELNKADTAQHLMDYEIATLRNADHILPGLSGFINEYLLLYKSYLDQSFDYAREYLAILRKHLYDYAVQDHKNRGDYEAAAANVERICSLHFATLMEKMEENDLNWIAEIYQQKSAEMRERLRRDLKLDIPEP